MDPAKVDLKEYVLESEDAAKTVIETLYNIIRNRHAATVADLKRLVNVISQHHTDHKWGWGEGAEFSIRQVSEGYVLVLPEVTALSELMTSKALDLPPH